MVWLSEHFFAIFLQLQKYRSDTKCPFFKPQFDSLVEKYSCIHVVTFLTDS